MDSGRPADTDREHLLIVEKVHAPGEGAEEAFRTLHSRHGIDAYTARQRLLGRGRSLFSRGPKKKLAAMADLLREAGIRPWIIDPTPPRFMPARLTGLEVTPEALRLNTLRGAVVLGREMPAVGVLADVSGKLVDKHLKRFMAHYVYQGRTTGERLGEEEIRRAIFMGSPVFDLYLIDDDGRVAAAVRALPGKFDPKGLGERASVSSRTNLDALVRLAGEYASPFSLHLDFGLSQLPGCRLRRREESPDYLRANLASVAHYGWLMTDLELQPREGEEKPGPAADPLPAGTLAAALQQPALAAAGLLETVSPSGDTAGALDPDPVAEVPSSGEGPEEDALGEGLPPPPPPERRISWQVAAGYLVAAGIAAWVFMGIGTSYLSGILRYTYSTGALPALAALGLFAGGFTFLHLKRRIEHTPTSRVRSLAMGLVEVYGRARRKYALVAPMTQTPCVYYRVRKYSREEGGGWQPRGSIRSGRVPFFVEDDTGRVLVDPAGATIRSGASQTGLSSHPGIIFQEHGSHDSDEKWVEETIADGTFLYVLGTAMIRRRRTPSLRERRIEKLRALKLDRAALQKYDTDGDGKVGIEEWQAAREDVEEEIMRERLAGSGTALRQEDHICIGRSRYRSHPFVIADTRSETHVTRTFLLTGILLLAASLPVFIWAIVKAVRFFRLS